jgi:alkanesulfonate monooxygenase SsuD/methylene tetrahydromethanopterin reductase-like flavin-dependent oxidoreductase (luciferase family)
MLPNHATYVIAEQFGTLARLFPGRIDLGLGRAPGTDQLTLRALRRTTVPLVSMRYPSRRNIDRPNLGRVTMGRL